MRAFKYTGSEHGGQASKIVAPSWGVHSRGEVTFRRKNGAAAKRNGFL